MIHTGVLLQSLLSDTRARKPPATENYKLRTQHNRPRLRKPASCAQSNGNGDPLSMKHFLPCCVLAGIVLAPMAAAQQDPSRSAAESRLRLAQVEEAEVLVQQSDVLLASLYAAGVLSSPCSVLDRPDLRRRGKVFRVVLREQDDATGRYCQSFGSGRAPFYVSLPLDLQGLQAGSYRVLVNDLDLQFTIP